MLKALVMQDLALATYGKVNAAAFGSRLSTQPHIVWNNRLRSTAGRVQIDVAAGAASDVLIELSPKLITSEPRLVNTLAHEMCHVAAWVLEGIATPRHGPAFSRMARHICKV